MAHSRDANETIELTDEASPGHSRRLTAVAFFTFFLLSLSIFSHKQSKLCIDNYFFNSISSGNWICLFLSSRSNEANILGISSGNQGDTGSEVLHHASYDNQGGGMILNSNSNSNFPLGRSSSLSSVFPHGPYCEAYRGSVCSQHLKNASIYVTSRSDQSYLELQLNNVLKHVETWSEISPQCHRFAMPLLCFTAFSLCDEYSSEVIPRKVRYLSLLSALFLVKRQINSVNIFLASPGLSR